MNGLSLAVRAVPLRWRLAAILALVLSATLGAVVTAAGVVAERVLVDATADRLEIGAGLLGERPRRGPPVTELHASEVVRLLGAQQTAVAIVDDAGRTLAAADNGAPAPVADARHAPEAYAAIVSTGTPLREVVEVDGGRVLVVSAPIRLTGSDARPRDRGGRGGGPAFVPPGQQRRAGPSAAPGSEPTTPVAANAVAQLAVSLDPVDASVAGLRAQIVALGIAALLVALAVTILATRHATRPLTRVAAAAERLASGDLSARTGLAGRDEVGALGLAFDAMAGRLEAAFRAQRAFAADASHELRTPLSILGGYVDLLARAAGDGENRRLLGSMRREIDRLSRLAGDLLLATQIEAGGLVLQPRDVDLADLAREVAEASRMLDASVPIVVEADEPLPATVDPDRVAQAVQNLVENAVRHAAPGSPIRVRAARAGTDAMIEVWNAGVPIPADELPRLFERFVRRSAERDAVASGTVSGGGTTPAPRRPAAGAGGIGPEAAGHAGLGLPIARAIAEASGGSIVAASDASGTRFTIRLPLSPRPHSQPLLSEQPSTLA